MAEEQTTETTQTEETKSGQVIFNSQEDFDAVITRRIAKEREKFSDYDDVKSELEKVRQAEKERVEKELTDSEKLKKELEEKESQIADLSVHKDWHEEWERRETEKIEKAMDEFSDDDKDLVNALPLDRRMIMIEKLSSKDTSIASPQTGKSYFNGQPVPTPKEAMEIRTKFGADSLEYRQAAELIRKSKGN